MFLSLFKRYLASNPSKDASGREYPWYRNEIELLTFCLMPNHYHLLVFQSEKDAFTKLLRSICTAYTMYFNKKYKRVGHLFQSRFKASMIQKDSYLLHISRYIHLNPDNYKSWRYSSLPYYLNEKHADWLNPKPVLELFDSKRQYLEFIEDYEDYREMLSQIKNELANT